ATRTTAVLVTHDQDEAFAVADRVAVMDRGRILQVGTPADLWQRPADRRVAEFLGYEAFVPVGASAAAPLVRALGERAGHGGARTGVGRAGAAATGGDAAVVGASAPGADVVALAEGAFVVERVGSPGVVGAIGEDGVKGVVLAVTSRRGRSEVRVDVDGIGPVTALAPVGVQLDPGSVVPLAVDPDALAVLPLDAP
ncbi:TOBE domain-containing protein, partial [Cellulomonas fimi]